VSQCRFIRRDRPLQVPERLCGGTYIEAAVSEPYCVLRAPRPTRYPTE
jgi:hypothetical protein